jgi:hypothetical protein
LTATPNGGKERIMTVQQINQQLINLAAKVQLERAEQLPDPATPYLLQLARWGQDGFLDGESEDLTCLLTELLSKLLLADPETAVKMFYPHREQANDVAEELLRMSPMDAASLALEDLVREAIDMTYIRFIPPPSGVNQARCTFPFS